MRRDQALKILAGQRETLYSRYGVDTLSVFGPVTRDEAGDVDILATFECSPGMFQFLRLKE